MNQRMSTEQIRSNLVRGCVEMMVLDLLFDKERSASEIINMLDTTDNGTIPDKTIYGALYRLTDEGCIIPKRVPKKGNFYRITEMGRTLAKEMETEYLLIAGMIKMVKDMRVQDFSSNS